MARPLRAMLPLLAIAFLSLPRTATGQELTQIQTVRDEAGGLGGARGIAVSPDGAHAYVAGTADDSIAIFAYDPFGGRWTYLGRQTDGVDGVDGLDGVVDVAVSPDGLFVYAVGENDDAIAVFDRSPGSGLLTFLGAVRDGQLGADRLDRPVALSVVPSGPDAGRLFVVSFAEHALTAFDLSFPTLAWVGTWRHGEAGVEGLAAPTDVVALAGDHGADVYVTSQGESALAVFTTDFLGSFGQRQVLRDGQNGVDGLQSPQAVAALPNGDQIFVAANGEDAVSSFLRGNDGLITPHSIARNGVAGVFGIDGVLGLEAEPGGEFVFATGGTPLLFNWIPQIARFGIDPFGLDLVFADGVSLPSYSALVFYVPPARIGLAFPNDQQLLATDPVYSTLNVFARDPATGALSLDARVEDGAGVVGTVGAQVVVASPDGENVYVLGRDEAQVTELARDPATGALSYAGTQRTSGLLLPITPRWRNATMSPDGKNLYVFDYRQRRIGVFRRDVVPGRLLHAQDVVSGGAGLAEFLQFDAGAVSPDGSRLYVISPLQDAISVFARDPATGLLAYLQTHYESPDLQIGMDSPQEIVAGPGGSVYVGGSVNLLHPLEIDFAANGDVVATVTLAVQPGQPICNGLSLAFDAAFSHLVTGQHGNHVCVYSRSPSGTLTLRGHAAVPGRSGYVHSVAMSPNGRRVYAALYDGLHPNVGHSALAVFSLDPATSTLALLDTLSDQSPGVDDTQGLISLAVSPDGRNVYGAAYLDDAVVAFAPEPGAGLLAGAALAGLLVRRRRHAGSSRRSPATRLAGHVLSARARSH